MELRHLRYFAAVADYLSYSEASRHLHVAQPAISQTILDLEQEIGTKLFVRDKRSVQLSAAGTAFLGEVENILRRSDVAKRVAQRAARGELGILRIGFITSAIARIFPLVVQRYSRRNPEVELQLHHMIPDEQLAAFDQGIIDLGFSRALPRQRRSEFEEELVYTDHLEALFPRKHPLAKEKKINLEELASEPFVLLHRAEAPSLFDEVIASCHRAGFSPNVRHEADRMSTVFLLVECELGVSLVPSDVRGFERPQTVRRPLSAHHGVPLYVTWPRGSQSPTREAFLNMLRAQKAIIQKSNGRSLDHFSCC